jgi:hypothetical protein
MRPRRSAHALALLAAGILALSACGRAKPAESAAAAAPAPDSRAAWYQLREGVFQPIAGPAHAQPAPRLPWTVQSRVADLAAVDGLLYLALNGTGLARMGGGEAAPRFEYFPDDLIFAHRTVTTLVPRAAGVAVHLYYNALLNTVTAEQLALQGVSLVSFLPDRSDYAFLVSPFHRRNREWEAVGFAAASADEFLFEWKLSGPGETRFAHTRFFPGPRTESACSREAYVAALAAPLESLPARSARRRLLESCAAAVGKADPRASLLFTVRAADKALRRSYRWAPPADAKAAEAAEAARVLSVEAWEDRGSAWALLPGGRLLSMRAGGAVSVLALPALQAGARYTGIAVAGNTLVVPWEEQSFTDVGAAGILLYAIEG